MLDPDIDVGIVVASKSIGKSSLILLDAKHFKVRRDKYTLYVCADAISGRPLSWLLMQYAEKRDGYDRLLEVVCTENRHIQAVISDWHHTIRASVKNWCPLAVHQRCASHALQEVFRKICGKRLLATPNGKRLWKKIRRVALECDSEKEARQRFRLLRKSYPHHEKAWKKYELAISGIYEWTKRRDLPIPRTSNRIECLMGVIEQRLKSMRTMKNATQLAKIVSAYLQIKYKRPTKE